MRTLTLLLLLTRISAQGAKTTPADFGIELQNKVTAQVLVSIQSLPNGRQEYMYTLKNSVFSQQDLLNLYVQVKVPVAKADMIAAPGWFVGSAGIKRKLDDGSTKEVILWDSEEISALIKPGRSLGGFKLTVRSLPAIQDFLIQGYTDKAMVKMDLTEEESDVASDLQDEFKNNSFKGKTIGPDPVPEIINLAGLIDRLASLKHQGASLGWLGNTKFVIKLDERLDQAKAALAKDRKKLARTRLSQFVHDLTETRRKNEDKDRDHNDKDKDDQYREKFVSDEAFQLLKINADFLIAKLPTKAKDRDEDDECRRAENEKDDGR
jgi:hypothetical protein